MVDGPEVVAFLMTGSDNIRVLLHPILAWKLLDPAKVNEP